MNYWWKLAVVIAILSMMSPTCSPSPHHLSTPPSQTTNTPATGTIPTRGHCDQEALDQCVEAVNSFTAMFGHHAQLAGLARDYFDSKCRLLQQAADCARRILAYCHDVHNAYVEGQLQAQLYLCDNVDVYIEHQACLSNSFLQRDIEQCMHTEEHYEEAPDSPELCRAATHDLGCVHQHVLQRCNSTEAAFFQYQYDYLHIKQLLILLDCDIVSTDDTPTSASPSRLSTSQVHLVTTGADSLSKQSTSHHNDVESPTPAGPWTSPRSVESTAASAEPQKSHSQRQNYVVAAVVGTLLFLLCAVVVLAVMWLYCKRKQGKSRSTPLSGTRSTSTTQSSHQPVLTSTPRAESNGTAMENPLYGIMNSSGGSTNEPGVDQPGRFLPHVDDLSALNKDNITISPDYKLTSYKSEI